MCTREHLSCTLLPFHRPHARTRTCTFDQRNRPELPFDDGSFCPCSIVISVAALVVGIIAIVKAQQNERIQLQYTAYRVKELEEERMKKTL